MNKYELYKLKVAGLSNEQVFRIVSYWEMNGDWPDLEKIAQASRGVAIRLFYRALYSD